MPHIPLIFIIAGEASGDQLGAALMASLKTDRNICFAGIGGPAMTAQGLTSLFPMEELSLMGVVGILRQLPHLLRRLRYTVETVQQLNPDVVITIDAPEFSFRVLKRLHKLPKRPRLIHYVAPTVWAWRSGRAKKISRFVDRLLCLYPFEPPYFEKHGLKTVFVGHPVAKENIYPTSLSFTPSPFVLNLPKDSENHPSNLLCLLPGSRQSEIEALMPIFGQTIILLKKEIPDLKVVLPTLLGVKNLVEEQTQGWPVETHIVVGNEARDQAFQHSSVALAASGTVALQLAAASLPFVIAYKINKFNEMLARMLLKTPWACMVNILLAFHTLGPDFLLNRNAVKKVKKPWIPEFLQQDCTPENLASAVLKLFQDPQTRIQQEQAMSEALALLKAPPHIAAQNVLEEIKNP